MSTAVSASMQAALLIREKQRLRRKKFRKGRSELPSHVATKDIAPFPQYPPGFWVRIHKTKKNFSISFFVLLMIKEEKKTVREVCMLLKMV